MWFSGKKMLPQETVWQNLTQFYAVGAQRAHQICRQLNVHPRQVWGRLSPAAVERLRRWLAQETRLGNLGDGVRLREAGAVQVKARRGTLSGIRRRRGLPGRGQSTRANGMTARRLNGRRASLARGS